MRPFARCLVVVALVALSSVRGLAQPSMVILVRHAEKASQTETDPVLSAIGTQRAKDLATALADAHVTSVITTQFVRTKLTAAGVIEQTKAPTSVVEAGGPTPAHLAAVAAAVKARPAGDVVLVVGHSNTIPGIVTALGGPKLDNLCDSQYSIIYVLQMNGSNPPRLLRLNYGAADPPDATCARTMK